MSDTPITDAARFRQPAFDRNFVDAAVAEQLEITLAAVTAECDKLKAKLERKELVHNFTRRMWRQEKANLRQVTEELDAFKQILAETKVFLQKL